MNCFSIRLHDRKQEIYEKYKSVHDEGDILIVKELTSENKTIHYQSYWKTDIKKDAITKRLQRLEIKAGGSNQQYACTKIKDTDQDRERMIQYLCKGENKDTLPDVLFNNFLTDEQIKDYHDEYWMENEKLKDGKKSKKPYELSNFEKALEYVKKYGGNPMDPVGICERIISYYTEECKCEPNDFQLKNMTKSIITQLWAQQDMKKCKKFIHKRAKEIIGSEFKYDL